MTRTFGWLLGLNNVTSIDELEADLAAPWAQEGAFWVVAAAGIFAVGQFIEGNFLQPYLVGKETGLHPVWLMFSLLAFGVLFGFVGLLVAVPVAAAIGVLVRFLVRQYQASSYYTGDQPG